MMQKFTWWDSSKSCSKRKYLCSEKHPHLTFTLGSCNQNPALPSQVSLSPMCISRLGHLSHTTPAAWNWNHRQKINCVCWVVSNIMAFNVFCNKPTPSQSFPWKAKPHLSINHWQYNAWRSFPSSKSLLVNALVWNTTVSKYSTSLKRRN